MAKRGTVMLTITDYALYGFFGKNWIANVEAANISYYVLGAADDRTSQALAAAGYASRCFTIADSKGMWLLQLLHAAELPVLCYHNSCVWLGLAATDITSDQSPGATGLTFA